jgi:nucleoside-diphosphate-sugar epimerase
MNVLVIGANGFIGRHLMAALARQPGLTAVAGVRRPANAGQRRADLTDPASLAAALDGIDAVVCCAAGNAQVIADGAAALFQAAAARPQRPLVVNLSSMAVYGEASGVVDEGAPLQPQLGWYAAAKCAAEDHGRAYAAAGGPLVTLRPGIVYGPGSTAWVGRIGDWLRAGRLGDIGALGDGYCNLVHVDDVVAAILASLRTPAAHGQVFNLAMPQPPRWNRYFVALSLALGVQPVRRRGEKWLRRDAKLLSIPLKLAQIVLGKLRLPHGWLPEPIPPSLLGLWQQEIVLDSSAAGRVLGLQWTPLDAGVASSAAWYRQQRG